MSSSDPQIVQLLTEIKEAIKNVNDGIHDIRDDLKTDRAWTWKVLLLTIGGSFALIGIKLAVP
jgi:hypothetical protein